MQLVWLKIGNLNSIISSHHTPDGICLILHRRIGYELNGIDPGKDIRAGIERQSRISVGG